MTYSANSFMKVAFCGMGLRHSYRFDGYLDQIRGESFAAETGERWLGWGTVPPSQTKQASFV